MSHRNIEYKNFNKKKIKKLIKMLDEGTDVLIIDNINLNCRNGTRIFRKLKRDHEKCKNRVTKFYINSLLDDDRLYYMFNVFKLIDTIELIEMNKLSVLSIFLLAELIESSKTLRSLTVKAEYFDFTLVYNAIGQNTIIKDFKCSSRVITDENIKMLLECNSSLNTLILEKSLIQDGANLFEYLLNNKNLKNFSISSCDMRDISKVNEEINFNNTLEILDVSNNNITRYMSNFSFVLNNFLSLIFLNLEGTLVDLKLVSMYLKINPGLKTLILSFNEIQSVEDLNYLENINHLNISRNDIRDKGIINLIDKLKKNNLITLNISSNNIKKTGFKYLCDNLSFFTSLRTIYSTGNATDNNSFLYLLRSLKNNTVLREYNNLSFDFFGKRRNDGGLLMYHEFFNFFKVNNTVTKLTYHFFNKKFMNVINYFMMLNKVYVQHYNYTEDIEGDISSELKNIVSTLVICSKSVNFSIELINILVQQVVIEIKNDIKSFNNVSGIDGIELL